jgi:hypothetical protein
MKQSISTIKAFPIKSLWLTSVSASLTSISMDEDSLFLQISCKWTQTVCSLCVYLLSLTMSVAFIHVILCISSTFFLLFKKIFISIKNKGISLWYLHIYIYCTFIKFTLSILFFLASVSHTLTCMKSLRTVLKMQILSPIFSCLIRPSMGLRNLFFFSGGSCFENLLQGVFWNTIWREHDFFLHKQMSFFSQREMGMTLV